LTRSARVSGLRGLEASLLISSSGICALEGGCDHVWTVEGKFAVVLLLFVARRRGAWTRFARDRKRIMAATRWHVDRQIYSRSTGRECWASLARTSDVGAERERLGSVTCGSTRPISSFGGAYDKHLLLFIITRYFFKDFRFSTNLFRKINRRSLLVFSPPKTTSPHLQFHGLPFETNSRLLQQHQPRCLSTM
jgi:hypothetical protein